jgi:uncharacterized protein YndB with AHSA1/START domain
MAYTIYHNVEINTTADNIYNAITSADGLEKWWPLKSTGMPIIGGVYTFYFSPEYDWAAQVTHCEANKYMEWTMLQSDEDWHQTSLVFKIEPSTQVCILSFEHRGWREANDHFRRTSYCWALYLRCLKLYLETSETVRYNDRTK